MTWDGSSQKWIVDKVQEWLHQVAVGAGRVEPEIGMVDAALPEPVEGNGSGSKQGRHWGG